MKHFLDQVGIREKLGTLDLPSPGSNRGYSSEQIIESFWVNVWTGASRYVHCNGLREDAVIRDIFGFKNMPSQSTYSRFFGKFSQQRNHAVFPQLQRWFFDQINIIAVRCYPNIKREIYGLKQWVEICHGLEVCEFTHQSQQKGARRRRHFVVRKRIARRPDAGGKLLFEDLPEYRYSSYVTNLKLPVTQIWSLYNGRADCENRIKELKQDFGLESFCLKDFWATEASFRWIMVAYNLMMLFQHTALNQGKTRTLKTLKSQCFAIGAWTCVHARKTVLKLSLPRKKRPWMDSIRQNIQQLTFPILILNA